MPEQLYPCNCCGFCTLSSPHSGSYEICPVCFWEDDGVQAEDPTYAGGANHVCLFEARRNYVRFGACDQESIRHVRPPALGEVPPPPILSGVTGERATQLRLGLKIQLLAIVRAMRAGEIGIIVGSTRVAPLVHQLDQPELENALLPFVGVASEVDDLPVGSVRDLWNADALAIKDQQLADYEFRIRERMLEDCRAIEGQLTADLMASLSE